METFVPSVTTPNLNPGTDNSQVGGSLDISGTNLGTLKPGTTLNVTLQPGLENFVNTVKLEVNNQLFEIPVKLNLTANTQNLQLPEQRSYPAEIRISASQPETATAAFKFITIDGRQPESFVQTLRRQNSPEQQVPLDNRSIINMTNGGIKPEVQLHNLSFKTVAAQVLDVKQLPPEMNAKLPPLELEIAFQQVVTPEKAVLLPETRAVVQNLKTILQQPQLPEFSNEVNAAAQKLIGKPLPAITLVRPEINLTSFQTPLGEVVSATPLRLDSQLPVELVIKSVVTPPDLQVQTAANPLAVSAQLVEKLAEMPAVFKSPEASQSVPVSVTKLLEVLKPLTLPEQTMAAVIAKLPSGDKQMLANLVNYVKAAVHQDIKQWLGPELVDHLAASSPEGKEALQLLTTVFSNSARETPAWRLVEIPFYNGENLEKIRLAVKKYNDEEDDSPEQQKQKYGTRFVVDTNFTKLGRFQFDGYSLLRDKRFDLIIRTERNVGNDLCANIMRIFKTTLHEVDYVGTIKVNVKENFIKIGEDVSNETLPTGIFI